MKKPALFLLLLAISISAFSQTLYVPNATTTGIANNTSNSNVGIGTSAPADQLEIVNGVRKVGFNGTIPSVTTGGLISMTHIGGGKSFFLGVAPNYFGDPVIFNGNASSEMRVSSGGANGLGIGFYVGQTAAEAFADTRGTPVVKISGAGNLGVGTVSPYTRLDVAGLGGDNVDIRATGQIQTGDGNYKGGMWVNYQKTMMFGASDVNKLGIYNQGDWRLTVNGSGHVGIGTPNAVYRLQVQGTGGTTIDMRVNGRMSTGDAGNTGGVYLNASSTMLVGQASATQVGFYNNNAWRMVVDNNGNVGIGTTAPDAPLTVKGKIHAKEVKVDLTGALAPDYVFDKDYALPSLEKVKEYIDKNHHLPEIPSAKEIEANGVELGEMNLLLLKKIEELTLYVIQLKEENEIQAKQIKELSHPKN